MANTQTIKVIKISILEAIELGIDQEIRDHIILTKSTDSRLVSLSYLNGFYYVDSKSARATELVLKYGFPVVDISVSITI